MSNEFNTNYDGVFAKATTGSIKVNTIIKRRESDVDYDNCTKKLNKFITNELNGLNYKCLLLIPKDNIAPHPDLPNEAEIETVSTVEQVAEIIASKFLLEIYIRNIEKLEYDKTKYVSVEENIYDLVKEQILYGENRTFCFSKVVKETI